MVFEVRATHRVTATGDAACEVHPDVFVDESGRAFVTGEAFEAESNVEVVRLPTEDEYAFVVEDEAIEFVFEWRGVLSDALDAEWRITERYRQRWTTAALPVPQFRKEVDRAALRHPERTVRFDVRASHRLVATRRLACEIYPDVFVGKNGHVLSRYAGMAMQQPGDIVEALPDGTQEWFSVSGLEDASAWVTTIARFGDSLWLEQHGGKRFFDTPVGPMGPACPPRRRLTAP